MQKKVYTALLAGIVGLLLYATSLHAAETDPPALYMTPTATPDARADDLIKRLTLQEKLKLLGGVDGFYTQAIERVGLPRFRMSDGPCGVRCAGPSTAYTAGVCLAATWDTALAERVGKSMGRDCRARGVHFLLGPGMNLYRAPMCGRNFEYLGEDPLLAGFTGAAVVRGIQSQGVAATIKHFAGNEQEFNRHDLSTDADEQTLRELHLRQFQIALREGNPECVMNSYNPLNGVHSTQNAWLNNDVLKGEFAFRGLLMSDWEACYDTQGMANGGLDLEMPGAKWFAAEKLQPLLDAGQVKMATIDDKVRRQLRVAFDMGWLDRPQQDLSIPLDDPASVAVNLDEARGGITLLKNEGNLLPLDPGKSRIVVLGSDHPVVGGGGSAYVSYFHAVGIYEGIANASADMGRVSRIVWEPGEINPAGGPGDLDAIRHADAVVVCVGFDDPGSFRANHGSSNEREGADRSYSLPEGQASLVNAVSKLNPHTVIVLNSGGSVETASWITSAAALLHDYYPGTAGNSALAEIIFGKANPSGKLPFSWEKKLHDAAAYENYPDRLHPKSNRYSEGVFLGYRWFDAKNIEPLFPFGFGLSYTRFEVSDLKVAMREKEQVEVSVQVRNAGARAGAEVVEVYCAEPGDSRPPRELKAFAKQKLEPGESKSISIRIRLDDLKSWDVQAKRWILRGGEYKFEAGDSSRNLPLTGTLVLTAKVDG